MTPGSTCRVPPVTGSVLAVALVAVLAGGCGAARGEEGAAAVPSSRAPSAPGATGTTATPATAATPGTTDADSAAGRPVPGPVGAAESTAPRALRPARIEVPAIGVDASLTELGIASDGAIEVPSVPGQAGWLDTTPAPGQQGPAVIAGHVDSETGPAVFYRLSSLAVGDEIDVVRHDGSTVRFTVDGVRRYPQSSFPTAEVYGPVPGPALRLITCGGDYVKAHGGYQDNVVVYAS